MSSEFVLLFPTLNPFPSAKFQTLLQPDILPPLSNLSVWFHDRYMSKSPGALAVAAVEACVAGLLGSGVVGLQSTASCRFWTAHYQLCRFHKDNSHVGQGSP